MAINKWINLLHFAQISN